MAKPFQNETHAYSSLLFLAGLFSLTRINLGGSIAVTELIMIFSAPFVFINTVSDMRKDGMGLVLVLFALWLVGAVFSDWYNETSWVFAIKGIATPITLLSCFVCMYAMLRRDLGRFKWFLLGAAFSYVLSTFFLSRASSLGLDLSAQDALARTVGYKLYWLLLAIQFISLPFVGWYLKTPTFYTITASIILAIMALLVGVRSTSLTWAASVLLLIIGRRNSLNMMKIKLHFVALLISILFVIVMMKGVYRFSVRQGWLGEGEMRKYELQTKEGDSALKMLMAGRTEFFVGLYAALESPFLGRGSWALDTTGVYPEFVYKYGAAEDYQVLMDSRKIQGGQYFIPFHTHVITYWMWHGVFGLIFWLYFLYNVVGTIKNRMHVVPALFGYFAVTIPTFVWDFFFSPLGARINEAMLLVICLIVKKMSKFSRITYMEG